MVGSGRRGARDGMGAIKTDWGREREREMMPAEGRKAS